MGDAKRAQAAVWCSSGVSSLPENGAEHLHFAHGQCGGLLARNGHDEKVWVCPMVGHTTDDDSGAAFHS